VLVVTSTAAAEQPEAAAEYADTEAEHAAPTVNESE
jgi:hypothetical protein